ncbi:hypothetical protein LLB_2691 [Legionella longbeachae D-4968]|nr:hypothetical protein LLB_2691 [Legionella longbeachae D-4968]
MINVHEQYFLFSRKKVPLYLSRETVKHSLEKAHYYHHQNNLA